MGKGNVTTTSGFTELPGARRHRQTLRQRLLLSSATEAPQRGGGTRRQRRAAKARGGIDFARLALRSVIGVALSTLFAGAAYANPLEGTVTAGAATIQSATPKSMEILQSTDKAIINWKSFSIDAGEKVTFQQPSAASVTLNRVTGNDPSKIMGSLSANGTVMLVNPNGVVIGAGAKVDVGGLVATTANISDANFMAGKYQFDQASTKPNAMVVNEGDITVKESGLAALVAPHVRNSGVIRAKLGKVALGGAETFTLDFHGDGLISFDASSAVKTVAKDADGKPVAALVVNSGEIAAEGGSVTLSARAVKGVIDNVINTDGVIKATSVGSANGKIVLSGGDNGKVNIGGTVDASGRGEGQTGGTVVATGAEIAVKKNARVDASGSKGGGEVAIGSKTGRSGTWSDKVTVEAGATLSADAVKSGKGGSVTVLSQKSTKHAGKISARGGAEGGDGGFAEVSSHKDITLTGSVDLTAPKGAAGTFLLDPESLRIVSSAGGSQDGAAADGTIGVNDPNLGSGDAVNTVSKQVLESIAGNANIVLEASGLITVETSLDLQTTTGHSFTLRSLTSSGIAFTDASYEIRTNGGDIVLEANGMASSLTNIGKLTTRGGAVRLTATDNVQLGNLIDTTPVSGSAGAVSVNAQSGTLTALDAGRIVGGPVTLTAGGAIGASGAAVSTSSTQLSLVTGGNLFVTNDQTLTDLSVTSTHRTVGADSQFFLASTGLTFTVTDSAGGTALDTISQVGGLNSFAFRGDRNIQVGTVNAGAGSVALTSTAGNITGTGASLLTGGALTLTARGSSGSNGAIGTSSQVLNTAGASLTATAGSGGINLSNTGALTLANLTSGGFTTIAATGNLTVGAVAIGSNTLTLTSSGGSILNDADASTTISSYSLVLNAAGSIGTSGTALTAGSYNIDATSGAGGVFLTTSGSAVLGSIVSTNGDVAITTGGTTTIGTITSANGTSSIAVTANGTVSDITATTVDAGAAGNVTLTTANGSISALSGTITGDNVTLTAGGSTSTVMVNTAAKRLTVTNNAGNVTVMQTGAVTVDNITSTGSSISLTVNGGAATLGTIKTTAGAISVTATGGAILGKDANNRLSANAISLSTDGAIGSFGTHLRTSTGSLTLSNVGDLYLDNSGVILTGLSITNRHVGGAANALELTSEYFNFVVGDNGTATILEAVGSPKLSTLTFDSDIDLIVGDLATVGTGGTVKLTSTTGSIRDDGSLNTRINADTVTLSAAAGSVGDANAPLALNATKLTLTTGGDLHVTNLSDLAELTVTSTHADTTVVNSYSITAPNFAFDLTDDATNGYLLRTLVDTTGQIFSFKGDRDIRLGRVDLTYKNGVLPDNGTPSPSETYSIFNAETTNGSILDDGSKTTVVLAGSVNLKASKAIGSGSGTEYLDIVTPVLNASAADGGIYITLPTSTGVNNQKNLITLGSRFFSAANNPIVVTATWGDIAFGSSFSSSASSDITVKATHGSILNPNSAGLRAGDTGTVTLTAGKDIGSASNALAVRGGTVVANAGGSLWLGLTGGNPVTLNSLTAGGDISVTQSSGTMTVGTVSANNGTGTVTLANTSGNIQDDSDSTTLIAAGKVILSANGSVGGTSALNLATANLSITTGGSVGITNTMALTDLTLTRGSYSGGTIGITTVNGQVFTLSDSSSQSTIQTVTSSTALNFAFNSSRAVKVGTVNVGTGGSVAIVSSNGVTNTGNGSKITAGKVSLEAGSSSSIGDSTLYGAINLDTGDLSVTSGRDIYVDNNGRAFNSLAITSTNATTASATKSTFSIGSTGSQIYSLADSGTTHTIDITGAGNSNFSFTGKKHIVVSEIVAGGGSVSLTTAGGGENSTITMAGGGTIAASSVTLSANGTGTNGGSIGTSTRAVKTSAASLTLVSNGDLYINNSNAALTALDVTATHKTSTTAGTYQFNALGSNRSFTVTEASGIQTLALSTPSNGSMNLRYSVDRGIVAGTIDAGTNSTGSVALISTGSASGAAGGPSINGSGTITAGSVSLTATGGNGNVGGTNQVQTSTQKLAIASGGNVTVSNNTTLTDLTLDFRHNKSGGGSNTYSISSTGLTASFSDSSLQEGLTVTNVTQSGLKLNISNDKAMRIAKIDVGSTGAVDLTANSGTSAISATNGSGTTVTAGSLALKATSVEHTSSGSYFTTQINTLSANLTGSLKLSNSGTLTLNDVKAGATADIKVTNSGSLLQSGTKPLRADKVTLTVEGGSIGASGTPLLTETRTLEVTAGRNVHLTNSADLHALSLDVRHASTGAQNVYDIRSEGLTFALTDTNTGSQYTLGSVVDASGLDFSFKSDNSVALGTINGGLARKVTIETTGTGKDIFSNGSSMVTAGTVTLTATGGIGQAGSSANHIATMADTLALTTATDAFVDNGLDLTALSLTSSRTTGAGTYQITAPQLVFTMTDDGITTTLSELTDTTGLAFKLDTQHALSIGTLNVQNWGTVDLTSAGGITGAASATANNPTNRITAGTATLSSGGAIGSSTNKIHLSASSATFNVKGDLYVESDTRIGTLKIKSALSTINDRTYNLTSVDTSGSAIALTGAESSTQAVLASLTDASGVRFTFDSHRKLVVGGLDVGKTGTIALIADPGIVGNGHSVLKINAGVASLTSSSNVVGANGGEFISITTGNLTVNANNGAVINLHGSTVIDSMSLGGALTLNNSTGDIALGSISMYGANAVINNQGGSILSGTISGSNLVNLTATGSIGNVSAISTQANSTSTTLTASAAGSIAVSESKSLIAQSVVSTGGGAIKLSTGSSGAGLLTAGTITTTGSVSLTSGDGSIDASNGNLVSGGSVELSAINGGIAATGSTLNVATTDLTIKTPGTFKVADTLDLAKLTIDRTPSTGTATSGTMSLTATNLSWNVTDSGGTTTFTTLTDSTGLDFTFKAPGAIAIGTVNTGASSTVSLTATGNSATAGNITAVNNSSTITAGSLKLDAQKKANEQGNSSAIGSNATALGMNVSSLTASSGTGGLFVKNAAGLNLSSITTGGALTVIAAAGDLTVSNLSYDSSKALTLTATAGRILNGGSSLSLGTGSATLTAGAGIGTADSAFKVTTSSTGALTTNVTGAGGLYLDIAGSLTGGLTAAVSNGPVVVSGSGNITLTNVAIATDAAGNSITVTSTGGSITAGTVTAGANNGSVTLSATGNGGKILAANGGSAVTGKTVALNGAGGIGTSSARVGVGGAQVQVNGGSGDIYLSTTGATALAYAATTGGKIDVQAGDRLQVVSASTGGGAITISSTAVDADIIAGSINAGTGAVTLSSSGGGVYDDGLAETRIVGGSASLTGSKGVGTSSRSVQTTTGSLTLASATGSVYLTDASTGGVTVASATASSGSVTIESAGTMTVQSVSANTTNGTVALTAAGSILGSGNGTHVTGHSASLTANGGSIGVVTDAATGAGTPIKMNVSSLTGLTATGTTPVISVDNINSAALTLTSNLVTLGAGGSAYIRTAGNLDASAGLSMTSGNLLLQSGGVLTLPTAAINLGTGALTLKGTTDVVAAGASPRSLSITAGSLTFASGSNGGDTTLNTTVGTIDASLTGSGKNLTVNNTGTLTAATLGANGTVTATSSTGMTATSVTGVGTVSLTATTGDLTVGTVNVGTTGTITLSAAGGSLLTGNGTSLTGGTLNLTSNTGIGTSSAAFTSTIANISAMVTGTGGIYLAGTSFNLGNLATTDGDIAVTASGAISDGNATTGINAGGSGTISVVSTGGAVSLTKAVSSTGPDATRASVTVQGTSITLGNVTTTGTQTYTGNTTLGGALSGKSVTVTGNLTLSGANRTVTATGGDLSVSGTLNGGGYGATLNAAQGGVTLGGAASNLASLSVTANTIGLRAVTTTGAQTYTGATSFQGAYATGNGAFTVTGATTLAGGTTVNSGSGNVLFSGTVNGANSLVITSSGATQFTGTVGGTTALTTLTIDAGGTASVKSVTTTGAQTYSGTVTLDGTYTTGAVFSAIGAVTLAGNTTVDGTSSVVFMNTVDGAYALAINNQGMAQFNGAVGGTTALASLTTNAGGTSSVKSVTTTGAQTYNDAVTLDGIYNTGSGAFTANAATTLAGATTVNGGAVLFAGTVDGAYALAVNSKAATQFTGTVGGTTALASLTTDAGGTSSLRNVTTTGAQTYNDAVTLNGTYTTTTGAFTANAATTLAGATTVNGGSSVLFAGTVDGAYALAINNKSTTQFTGTVGGTTALASLTTDAAGTSSLKSVTTTGAQTYNDAVTLDGTYTGGSFTTSAAATLGGATTVNAGTATFNGTVNGAQALTIAGTGTAQFNAAVGGTTALASLTTNAGATASFLNVTTSGAQTHNAATTLDGTYTTTTGAFTANGAVTLAGDTTVNGGSSVLFAGTVDGAYALAVNNKGATQFTGAVGGTTALASLTTDAGGTTSLRNVTTTGAQTYNDAVTLNGTYTTTTGAFTANGATTLAGATTVNGGSSVLFAGTVDGAQALVINSKAATQFTGTVGGTTALASLTTDAGGTSSLRNVTTTGVQTYNDAVTLNGTYTTTTGAFTANGAVTLAGDTMVNGGSSVLFAGTVDGAYALAVNNKGATQFTGTVGGTTALASLTTDAGGTTSLRNVVTTGAQTYNDAVTLNGLYSAGGAFSANGATTLAGTTMVYGGLGILFAGTVDGAYALAVNNKGTTAFNGAVGGTTALVSLTTDSGSASLKSVTTTGAQTYNNAVTLDGTYTGGTFTTNAAATLAGATTVNAGTATFNGTVNGAQALTIAGTGTAQFNAAVGGTTALASLTTNAGATASFLNVTTSGTQTHNAATTLNGTYSSTNSAITFNGATTLAGATSVNAGYGTITFNGTVNGAQALTATSTGAMVFNAAVGGTTALASLTTGTGYTSLVNVTTAGDQSYGGETSLMGTYATGNGAFTVAGPVTLAGTTTVDAGSGAVTFNGTVNGAQALTVNSSGATQFNAAVGGTTALASLTTDADGTTSLRSVTTSGDQTYNDATTLNGSYNSTDSAITFNGATTLAGITAVDAGYGTITFNGTVNGAQALTATSTGAMVFNAAVGGTTALASLTTGTGYTSLVNVTTAGAQSYGGETSLMGTYATGNGTFTVAGPVTLAGTTTVDAGSGAVTFNGTVNGAQALTVNSSGATQFNAAVGGTTALASLTTDADGTTSLRSVTTSGAQTYNDAVTLDGAYQTGTVFTAAKAVTLGGDSRITGTEGIVLASTLDGGRALTLTSGSGDVLLGGAVGGSSRLGALTINGGGTTTIADTVKAASLATDATGITILNGGSVDTTGAQSYADAVTLGADTVLTGTQVALSGGIDAAEAGRQSLTIAGNAALAGTLGTRQALAALTVGGETLLTGATAVTSGAQTYGGAVRLAGAPSALAGTGVTFAGALDGGQALTVTSGTGDAVFAGTVGGTERLGDLTVYSAGQTRFAQSVRAASVVTDAAGTLALNGGSVDTTGTQTYGERAVLGTDTLLTGRTVVLAGGLDAATRSGQGLTIAGDAIVNGLIGGTQALSRLSVTGTAALNGGAVTTVAEQSFGGAVTLGVDTVLTGGTVSLLNGGSAANAGVQGLTVEGDAVLAGVFGETGALRQIVVNGGTRLDGATVTTTGAQRFGGALTVTGASALTSTGGDLVFGGAVDSANRSALSLNGASIRAAGDIGASGLMGDVTVRTSGGVFYDGAVTVRSLTQTAGGESRFAKTLTATGTDGLRLTGAGFTFGAAVNSAGSLALVTTDGAGMVTFGRDATVVTEGGFTQSGGSGIVLPTSITAKTGPITLGAVASLPDGQASIAAGGPITMAGLQGKATMLTMASDGGALLIGQETGTALQKIDVLSLTVPKAGSARMFGTVAGRTDALAASAIDSPLRAAPYFINNTPWGPTQQVSRVAATVVVVVPVPSTPGVASLFTGTMTRAGLTPNALAAYAAPQVLTLAGTTPSLTGVGAQPEVLSTGAGTNPSTTRAGAQPEVLTTGPAPSATGNQQTEEEEAR
ncbi:filamentous hemagglutinin N-terminal domain-containing protein (plasmid) [Azospirillum argentinense]|uniref:Filamentous hemagglutinin N-terminal domain-containing protein n=1 Tax=Azospirillum argentinense TaxID=2970906 RepID=A0A4D8PRS8_9PROT|nr:filamentous hemagglutinin N-terminal domain-containing protein [Azospirillum argentinense]QCN98175.1 filamentous hemagglutinin N-terminal domain-containing protein [Azospirillum argentinense]